MPTTATSIDRSRRRLAIDAAASVGGASFAPGESILRRTVSANLLYVLNTVVRSFTTLAVMPLLIHWMGADEYALWVTICAVTMYVCLSEAGLGQAVVNSVGAAYARGDLERVGQIQSSAFALYWLMVTPVAVACLAALSWLPVDHWMLAPEDQGYGGLLVFCLRISILLALMRIPLLVFPAVLSGLRLLPHRLTWELATGLLAAGASVGAAWAGLGLMGVSTATNAVLLVAAAAVYLQSARNRPWARIRARHIRSDLFRPLATSSFFFFVISGSFLLDRTAISLLVAKLGALELVPALFLILSVYRVAGWSLVNSLSRALQPYVLCWHTREDHASVQRTLVGGTKLTTIAAALFVCCTAPLMEPLVELWVGKGAFPGPLVLLMFVAAFLVDSMFVTPVNLLIVLNRQRGLSAAIAAKSILVVAAAGGCGAAFDDPVLGLATGLLAGTLVGSIVMLWVVRATMLRSGEFTLAIPNLQPLLSCVLAVAIASVGTAAETLVERLVIVGAGSAVLLAWSWGVVLSDAERASGRALLRRVLPARLRA